MNRKWTVLALTVGVTALFATGLSIAADDDESPLHKIMEKVQKENVFITKAVRSQVNFKKSQKEVVTHAEELIKLGKEARQFKEPSVEKKQPYEKWTAFMDDFLKTTEEFAKEAAKPTAAQPQVKDAYKNVAKKCTACHEVFKSEDD
ncbi:MAG TPA: cytochrome c [Isosphaeraceae bacterium]|jgi:cytochrome c556|nr:cytochrome c [Isosphaeraceae bacterium]